MYRYYYNSNNKIIASLNYKNIILLDPPADAQGWCEQSNKIIINDYEYDPDTQSLVPVNQ
jgi:hypothetical protein